MQNALTKKQMRRHIAALKKSLTLFDRYCGQNIRFLNEHCFYTHARNFADIGELLDILEPYIPLTLSEDNFDFFIKSMQNLDNNTSQTPDLFSQRAKMDFVVSLRQVKDHAQWERIVNVCDAIRDIKEDLLLFAD